MFFKTTLLFLTILFANFAFSKKDKETNDTLTTSSFYLSMEPLTLESATILAERAHQIFRPKFLSKPVSAECINYDHLQVIDFETVDKTNKKRDKNRKKNGEDFNGIDDEDENEIESETEATTTRKKRNRVKKAMSDKVTYALSVPGKEDSCIHVVCKAINKKVIKKSQQSENLSIKCKSKGKYFRSGKPQKKDS